MQFGIRQKTPGVGDLNSCLKITNVETGTEYTVSLKDKMINDGENMCSLYFDDSIFLSPAQFENNK